MTHTLGMLRQGKKDFEELNALRGKDAEAYIPFLKERFPTIADIRQLAESYASFLKEKPNFMIHAPYTFIKHEPSQLRLFCIFEQPYYMLQVFYPSVAVGIDGKLSAKLCWTGWKRIDPPKKET